MPDEVAVAQKAYDTWETFGGKALGNWGGPYTEDAWVEVVRTVLRAYGLGAEEKDQG